jgi:thiol-disulfide isomerase/thioredoxin
MSWTPLTGFLVAAAVLVAATAFGLVRAARDGRVRRRATAAPAQVLSADDVGELGHTATLVQFSTEWCQPCRAARRLLGEVAADDDGVRQVEIDADSRLDLVHRFAITRTPTVLVLDHTGTVVSRVVGVPRVADLLAEVAALVPAS